MERGADHSWSPVPGERAGLLLSALQRLVGFVAVIGAVIGVSLVLSSLGSTTATAQDGVPADGGRQARLAIAVAGEEIDELRFQMQDPSGVMEGETLVRLLRVPGLVKASAVAIDSLAGSPVADVSFRRQRELTALHALAASLERDIEALIVSQPGSLEYRTARSHLVASLSETRTELSESAGAIQAWSETLFRNQVNEHQAAMEESIDLLSLQALAAAVAVVTAAVGAWLLVSAGRRDERLALGG